MHLHAIVSGLLVLLLATALPLQAQPAEPDSVKYWIHLTDKPEAAKADARAHLSERALERRQRRGTRTGTRLDAPVSTTYLDGLARAGVEPLVTSRWLNAVSAYLTADEAARVEALPFVRALRPVGTRIPHASSVQAPVAPEPGIPYARTTTQIDYGHAHTQLALMNAIPPLERGINGAGVILGFLDTTFGDFQHPAFQHLVDDNRILGVEDFAQGPQNNTHGLSVASTAVGFAEGLLVGPGYGASVLAATTEYAPSETNQEEDNLVAGMEWIEAEGADVVNISLGYTTFDPGERSYTIEDLDGDTGITTRIVDVAASLGVVVVTSAGNAGCFSPEQCWYYIGTPADADSNIAVGAVHPNGTKTVFSSFGPTADGRIKPDVAAMGDSVVVAIPTAGYALSAGTSFSSPLVAGVVTQMLQVNPDLGPIEVRDILRATASQSDSPDNALGWGIVDADAAIRAAERETVDVTPPDVPSTLTVTSVYPNPARHHATLDVTLPAEGGRARLVLYDVLGRRVATPFDGVLPGGDHRLTVALGDLPAGPYFFRLEHGAHTVTGMLTHVR